MFSKTCEHGIKAVIYITTQSMDGRRPKIGEISKNTGTPEAFTAKVLGLLTRNNIINSYTGPNGGFDVNTEQMHNVKMSDIVSAIDGDAIYNGCGLGLSECSHEFPCPMHEKFVFVRRQIKDMLTQTTLYELALGLKNGKTVLFR